MPRGDDGEGQLPRRAVIGAYIISSHAFNGLHDSPHPAYGRAAIHDSSIIFRSTLATRCHLWAVKLRPSILKLEENHAHTYASGYFYSLWGRKKDVVVLAIWSILMFCGMLFTTIYS